MTARFDDTLNPRLEAEGLLDEAEEFRRLAETLL